MNGDRALRAMADAGIQPAVSGCEEAISLTSNDMRVNTAAMRSVGIEGTPGFLVRLPNGREQVFTGWDAAAIAAFAGVALE